MPSTSSSSSDPSDNKDNKPSSLLSQNDDSNPSSSSSSPTDPTVVSSENNKKKKKKKTSMKATNDISTTTSMIVQIVVHIFCIGLYLIPILQENKYGGPTLDELHIMSKDNLDIHGSVGNTTSIIKQIFQNDYWGRPMQSESSHKSWRPLTVLSFRYLKGLDLSKQLTMHRFINILTHAATAEVIGILATRLFVQPTLHEQLLLRMITKIVFILHPTHVEVTANAANRNHIMAVLFSTLLCDPNVPIWLFAFSLIAGFLASETFLFQVPAAAVTLVVCYYYHHKRQQSQRNNKSISSPDESTTNTSSSLLLKVIQDYLMCVVIVLPRLFLMVLSIVVYLGGRKYFDTLDIPEGLIRPAENPFYNFTGEHRIRNYIYTLGIHIAKSWGFDPIGFSHEYGYDCIPSIDDWNDPRLSLPVGIGFALVLSILAALLWPHKWLGYVAIHWAWLLTLFPVSGVVKVGTFVSDRIVVASTVSVSILIAIILHNWIICWRHKLPAQPLQLILVGWIFSLSYTKIHNRSLQWMDSISLMESALVTCPRFAKALMETSKIYSGLYPDLFDLDKSRNYLERAREIDPDMCDLHHQFAIVAVQQGNYIEYEEELTQAVVCPFTMQGAIAQWKRYWEVALANAHSESEKEKVQMRYEQSTIFIQEKVAEEQRQQQQQEAASQKKK